MNDTLITPGVMVAIGGFVGLWCLVAKGLSLMGWQRLAPFRAPQPLPHSQLMLPWAALGSVSYKGVIGASALAEGLALKPMILFRLGHPPLLIPWSAFGPFQTEKSFWSTVHSTTIHTPDGNRVAFEFSSDQLLKAAQGWIQRGDSPGGLSKETSLK